MTDSAIEKLSKETVKHAFYVLVVSCFWGLSLFITKPELFKETFLIQFFVLFCTSFIWCFLGCLFGFLLEITFIKFNILNKNTLQFIRVELYLLLVVFVKCVLIFFAYYYSLSFTEYLRFIFKSVVAIVLTLCLIFLMVKSMKSKIRKR
jgi:hypothetical protein